MQMREKGSTDKRHSLLNKFRADGSLDLCRRAGSMKGAESRQSIRLQCVIRIRFDALSYLLQITTPR